MSTFNQIEAAWRDQQSGARDQQYDEERLIEREDEPSGGIDGDAIANAANPFLPKPLKAGESVVRDQSAGDKGAPKKDAA